MWRAFTGWRIGMGLAFALCFPCFAEDIKILQVVPDGDDNLYVLAHHFDLKGHLRRARDDLSKTPQTSGTFWVFKVGPSGELVDTFGNGGALRISNEANKGFDFGTMTYSDGKLVVVGKFDKMPFGAQDAHLNNVGVQIVGEQDRQSAPERFVEHETHRGRDLIPYSATIDAKTGNIYIGTMVSGHHPPNGIVGLTRSGQLNLGFGNEGLMQFSERTVHSRQGVEYSGPLVRLLSANDGRITAVYASPDTSSLGPLNPLQERRLFDFPRVSYRLIEVSNKGGDQEVTKEASAPNTTLSGPTSALWLPNRDAFVSFEGQGSYLDFENARRIADTTLLKVIQNGHSEPAIAIDAPEPISPALLTDGRILLPIRNYFDTGEPAGNALKLTISQDSVQAERATFLCEDSLRALLD